MKAARSTTPESEPDACVEVANFETGVAVGFDLDGELSLGGRRVTRWGGWLRLTADDAKIPLALRSIRVHLGVNLRRDGSSVIVIDRVRVGDMVWDDVDEFHDVFGRAWAPHLRETALRAIMHAAHE